VIELLESETHLLNFHDLPNYDKVCKATIERARFPIESALKLAALMNQRAKEDLSNKDAFNAKGRQYVDEGRKLLQEVFGDESDHFFGIVMMSPNPMSPIEHKSTIEIAIDNKLVHFLEDPRIVRVFSVIHYIHRVEEYKSPHELQNGTMLMRHMFLCGAHWLSDEDFWRVFDLFCGSGKITIFHNAATVTALMENGLGRRPLASHLLTLWLVH